MQTFKTIINEESLARVYQHTHDRNIAIVTAMRANHKVETLEAARKKLGIPNLTNAQYNNILMRELKKLIQQAGYGYNKIKGRYIENFGTENATPVDERSIFIIGPKGDDGGKFLKFVKNLGNKYDQDSVLYKAATEKNAKLYGTSNRPDGWPKKDETHDVGEWHPNRYPEFHSVMRGGRSFAFESFGFIANEIGFSTRKEMEF